MQLVRRRSASEVTAYLAWARRQGLRNVLYLPGDGSQVLAYDAEKETYDTLSLSDYLGGMP